MVIQSAGHLGRVGLVAVMLLAIGGCASDVKRGGHASAKPAATTPAPVAQADTPEAKSTTVAAPAPTKPAEPVSSAAPTDGRRRAPALIGLDADLKDVDLSHYRGRWVVVHIIPATDIPKCGCQATEFTQLLVDMAALRATVIAVCDVDDESLQIARSLHGINALMVGDVDHKIARDWGALTTSKVDGQTIEQPRRKSVLVDPHGWIAAEWTVDTAAGHLDRVAAAIAAGKAAEQTASAAGR
ncbi:MAG: redoxin domain-containing protein [Phycisphaera sp.]|nr:redoxin domain-containing protein [Phycisphaera sp.]